MQFKPFEPGIEVRGLGLQWIVGGFRILPDTGLRYLTRYGLTTPGPDGKPTLDPDGWNSLEKFLACFEAVSRDVGPNVLHDIGRNLGLNAPLPPTIRDVDASLRAMDLTYHMFHRKAGAVMFDALTGRMLEGIGHYGFQRVGTEKKITSVCENPYPCDFDRGVVLGFAGRFEPRAKVEHVAGPCRKNGADACTYVVTW